MRINVSGYWAGKDRLVRRIIGAVLGRQSADQRQRMVELPCCRGPDGQLALEAHWEDSFDHAEQLLDDGTSRRVAVFVDDGERHVFIGTRLPPADASLTR